MLRYNTSGALSSVRSAQFECCVFKPQPTNPTDSTFILRFIANQLYIRICSKCTWLLRQFIQSLDVMQIISSAPSSSIMLISLQAVANHSVISVESLLLEELSMSLCCYPARSAFGEGKEGSLNQLCAWPASGIWDSTYSGGNSIRIDSKCK